MMPASVSFTADCLVSFFHRGKPKPMPNAIPGFSPMNDDQWNELLELMRIGLQSGMEFIWIDWSTVPQYAGM